MPNNSGNQQYDFDAFITKKMKKIDYTYQNLSKIVKIQNENCKAV